MHKIETRSEQFARFLEKPFAAMRGGLGWST
jgi:hypothetical protein